MNPLASQIYLFLTTNKTIDRINFAFKGEERIYKVYPSAYKIDVANFIRDEVIEVKRDNISSQNYMESDAEYKSGGWSHDTLVFIPTFNITTPINQGIVIHECTHAHIDIQNIGSHSRFEDEATSWLAQAVYLCALKKYETKNKPLLEKCEDAAIKILSGQYWVEKDYSVPIIREVAKVYKEANSTTRLYSNGVWRIRFRCN